MLAVNWPPQAPGAGTGDALELVQLLRRHPPRRMHADALEDVDDGHVAAVELAGQDRAAVHEHRRHVQAQHGHHRAGQALVAAGDADERVVAVAADGELDAIGDHLARDERRLHALVAHGDAVGHRDGAELARRAAGSETPFLADCAWRCSAMLQGAASFQHETTPTNGRRDLLLGEAHGIIVGAMRRARRPDRHMPARQLRLVERLGVHQLSLASRVVLLRRSPVLFEWIDRASRVRRGGFGNAN